MTHNEAIKTVLDDLMTRMPGVTAGKAFGYPSYSANGKTFLFVGETGISLKLPAARVQELIAKNGDTMHTFEPRAGSVWKEWVSIDLPNPNDYTAQESLYEESIAFVSR